MLVERFRRMPPRGLIVCLALLSSVVAAAPARAQHVDIQSFDVTPFIGLRMGGTFHIQPDDPTSVEATLKDASSYGFSAGVRYDDYSLIEFRWTRAQSELRFGAPFASLGSAVGEVTLNQFHADFTREFVIPEVKGLRTFLTASLGVTHLGTANDGFTRFSFGFGSGLKQFIGSRFAIRAEAQWLPILIEPSASGFACGTFQGCLVVLSGETVQQFQITVGPVVRF
jgi:hypothetical protein